jgi:uncharacterized protein YjbI with pentapeptide repeats
VAKFTLKQWSAVTSQQIRQFWQLFKNPDDRSFALDVVKTGISALGLAATIFAGVGLILNYQNAQDEKILNQERLVTERFSKAVEQLGHKEISVRIGSIYALERIARDSPKDYWTVIEILISFIRERSSLPLESDKNSQSPLQVATDARVALTVIGRRYSSQDPQNQWIDLSRTNLRGVDLFRANLRNANLIGVNLSDSDLRDADLRNANMNNANLSRSNLKGANLEGAKLDGVDFDGANLSSLQLADVDLSGRSLIEADFSGTRLDSINLRGAKLYNANFQKASLMIVDLSNADLRGVSFQEASIRTDINLYRYLGPRASFDNADLSDSNFSKANFSGELSFVGTNLSKADLSGLKSAIFCDFSNANLSNANLRGADLRGAIFNNANLSGADLSEADFRDIEFTPPDHFDPGKKKTIGLTLEQIRKAKNWNKALYDEDFRKQLGLPPASKTQKK